MDVQSLTVIQQVLVYLLLVAAFLGLWKLLSLLWKLPALIEARIDCAEAEEDLAYAEMRYYEALTESVKDRPNPASSTEVIDL